ncbi:SCO family protein [Mesorhizobium sp. dw_380]|uniref:SCO family protein n=1 Tax=Mesorhizobium sp. dw_380 TaxID=2812001 RepID=UPI001BDE11B3|nr:SCO family protein [Mesorhizobium sp. dw_380]
MSRRVKWLFLLFAAFAAFDIAALATLMIVRRPPDAAISWRGVSTGTADIRGPFILKTTDGKTVTDQTYRGKWVAVFFGYTSCPDACPTALSNIGVALGKLGNDAGKIQPLFISVDPDRDTSEVLSAFIDSFDHRIVGLSGTRAQIDATAKAYRVFYQLHKEQGDNYTVDHSAYFYLMDPDGKFADVVEGTTPGEQMADKISKLIADRPT